MVKDFIHSLHWQDKTIVIIVCKEAKVYVINQEKEAILSLLKLQTGSTAR